MDKQKMYDYLRQHEYMAMATSTVDGKPEVATVSFVMDGDDLLLNTYTYYRKYQNLLDNPRVACVISTDHDFTLQFEATVVQLSGDEAEATKAKMLAAQPLYADYFNEDTRFFRLKPTWMRLRDYTKDPEEVLEYTP